MVCKIKKKSIEFVVLAQGETFTHEGEIYMKTSTGNDFFRCNCVNLSSGNLVFFEDMEKVERINMECKEV